MTPEAKDDLAKLWAALIFAACCGVVGWVCGVIVTTAVVVISVVM